MLIVLPGVLCFNLYCNSSFTKTGGQGSFINGNMGAFCFSLIFFCIFQILFSQIVLVR